MYYYTTLSYHSPLGNRMQKIQQEKEYLSQRPPPMKPQPKLSGVHTMNTNDSTETSEEHEYEYIMMRYRITIMYA